MQTMRTAISSLHGKAITYLIVSLPLPCITHALQSTTRVKPFICTMPMRLDEGWNQIQFNLSDFTRRAYGGGRWTCNNGSNRRARQMLLQSTHVHG